MHVYTQITPFNFLEILNASNIHEKYNINAVTQWFQALGYVYFLNAISKLCLLLKRSRYIFYF